MFDKTASNALDDVASPMFTFPVALTLNFVLPPTCKSKRFPVNVDVAFIANIVPVAEPLKLPVPPPNTPFPIESNPKVVVAVGVPTIFKSETGDAVPIPMFPALAPPADAKNVWVRLLSNTEILFETICAETISGLPSPLRSPVATKYGFVPTA